MGHDFSVCHTKDRRVSAAKALADGKVKLPAMVLFIDAVVVPKTAAGLVEASDTFVSVTLAGVPLRQLLDGGELDTPRSDLPPHIPMLRVPSDALTIPARSSNGRLRVQLYHYGQGLASTPVSGTTSSSSAMDAEGKTTVIAELSVPLSGFLCYGAPLYASVWLGLDDSGTHIEDDFDSALRRARVPGVPKVKVRLFKPSVPVEVLQQPSSGIREVAPGVKTALADKSWWEDSASGFDELPGDSSGTLEQVEGLIRCLEESNAMVQAHEHEQEKQAANALNFKAMLEVMEDTKRSATDRANSMPIEKLQQSIRKPPSSSKGSLASGGRMRFKGIKTELEQIHDKVLQRRASLKGGGNEGSGDVNLDNVPSSSPRRPQVSPKIDVSTECDIDVLREEVRRLSRELDAERNSHVCQVQQLETQLGRKSEELTSASNTNARLTREAASLRKTLCEVTALQEAMPIDRRSTAEDTWTQEDGARKTSRTKDELEPEPEEDNGGTLRAANGKLLDQLAMDYARELEKLELLLVEERQRSAVLLEENQSKEAAHQRDIAALEDMLQTLLEELHSRTPMQVPSTPNSRSQGFTRFSVAPNPTAVAGKTVLRMRGAGTSI